MTETVLGSDDTTLNNKENETMNLHPLGGRTDLGWEERQTIHKLKESQGAGYEEAAGICILNREL